MKNKNRKALTELESYYRAKNKKRVWWHKNRRKFVDYPLIGLLVVYMFVLLSCIITKTGYEILCRIGFLP